MYDVHNLSLEIGMACLYITKPQKRQLARLKIFGLEANGSVHHEWHKRNEK